MTTTIAHASIERTCALIGIARTVDLTSDCTRLISAELKRRCRKYCRQAYMGGFDVVVGLEG